MLKDNLITLFERDLNKLKDEILLFKDVKKLWATNKDIKNSSGNLCLHLCGNLRFLIGAVLGKIDYKRDRNAEFALKNVPRSELVKNVDKTIKAVKESLSKLNEKDFQKIFPMELIKKDATTEFILIHLVGHLNYHLGQINYHRRLIE